MVNFIYISGIISLIIQIFTGVFDYYVLQLEIPPTILLLKSLLLLEFVVQIIEGTFYVWLVSSFSVLSDITRFRYYDWFITTPTMLFTYTFYLLYLKHEERNEVIEKSLYELIGENYKILIPIFVLNAIMLLFGYLGEIKKYPHYVTAFFGFIPFILMFYIIYENYAVFSKDGIQTFWFFCVIWSLYGFASVLPYVAKNVTYNILDLFSKNFFGIYLAIILLNANMNLNQPVKVVS